MPRLDILGQATPTLVVFVVRDMVSVSVSAAGGGDPAPWFPVDHENAAAMRWTGWRNVFVSHATWLSFYEYRSDIIWRCLAGGVPSRP